MDRAIPLSCKDQLYSDESDLLSRLLASDESVFGDILIIAHKRLQSSRLRALSTALPAYDFEDIVMIALVRLWNDRLRFDERSGSIWPWFYGIAVNVLRELRRKVPFYGEVSLG